MPCLRKVCGLSLEQSVLVVGGIQLCVTVIATSLNVIKFLSENSKYVDNSECEDDVCIGPLIKYTVFDAFFGLVSSLLLIFGSRFRHQCLLITWIIITCVTSVKYIWVILTHDWTSLEDWISITYLLFYVLSTVIVVSFISELSVRPGLILDQPEPVRSTGIVTVSHHQQPAGVVPYQQHYQQQQTVLPQQVYPELRMADFYT